MSEPFLPFISSIPLPYFDVPYIFVLYLLVISKNKLAPRPSNGTLNGGNLDGVRVGGKRKKILILERGLDLV